MHVCANCFLLQDAGWQGQQPRPSYCGQSPCQPLPTGLGLLESISDFAFQGTEALAAIHRLGLKTLESCVLSEAQGFKSFSRNIYDGNILCRAQKRHLENTQLGEQWDPPTQHSWVAILKLGIPLGTPFVYVVLGTNRYSCVLTYFCNLFYH